MKAWKRDSWDQNSKAAFGDPVRLLHAELMYVKKKFKKSKSYGVPKGKDLVDPPS